jgi:hypothetical protein
MPLVSLFWIIRRSDEQSGGMVCESYAVCNLYCCLNEFIGLVWIFITSDQPILASVRLVFDLLTSRLSIGCAHYSKQRTASYALIALEWYPRINGIHHVPHRSSENQGFEEFTQSSPNHNNNSNYNNNDAGDSCATLYEAVDPNGFGSSSD